MGVITPRSQTLFENAIRETLFRGSARGFARSLAHETRETEFRGSAFPNGVWERGKKTVTVFTGPDDSTTLTEADTLTGGDVLPGFELPLAEYFDDPMLNPRARG